MIGKQFSRLKIIDEALPYHYPNSNCTLKKWKVLCSCGVIKDVIENHLLSGATTSCGCYNREVSTKHGLSSTREYSAWCSMLERCYKPSDKDSKVYQDIKVCDRWKKSVENFIEDMGECPEGYEIDRIDPTGGYYKENCRWVDQVEQAYNRSNFSNNTSGRTGVTWSKEHNKWRVYLYKNKQRIEGGLWPSFEDACKKREELELQHYGYLKK